MAAPPFANPVNRLALEYALLHALGNTINDTPRSSGCDASPESLYRPMSYDYLCSHCVKKCDRLCNRSYFQGVRGLDNKLIVREA